MSTYMLPLAGDGWDIRDDNYPIYTPEWMNEPAYEQPSMFKGVWLNVHQKWKPELYDLFDRYRVTALMLHEWEDDLEFLRPLAKALKSLTIEIPRGVNASAVSALKRLEDLQAIGDISTIDFLSLKGLHTLWIDCLASNWNECSWIKRLNAAAVKLKDLVPLRKMSGLRYLNCGTSAMQSFNGIEALSGLVNFSFGDCKWESLNGIEALKNLKVLSLGMMPRLKDINAVAGLAKLEGISLDRIPLLRDISPLQACKQLVWIHLNECREIETLKPLRGLNQLKSFGFCSTGKANVADGDLNPLLELPNLEEIPMDPRRHYKPDYKTVAAAIAERKNEREKVKGKEK